MYIRKANPEDHQVLTALTKLSKAHWNYSAEQIVKWASVLTITEQFIKENQVFKLTLKGRVLGYYGYVSQSGNAVLLDSLFVHPMYIGQGLGKLLMDDFMKRIKNEGIVKVILEADPNATAFYERYGFITIDQKQSDIPGRYLPIMQLNIAD